MRTLFLLAAVLSACSVIGAPDDPFPPFGELPKEVVFPRRAEVSVDKAGNLLVDGVPRYLFGAQVASNRLAASFAPTPGYPAALKWVYEEPLGYESAQRLGFDTFALFLSPYPWLETLNPAYSGIGKSEADRAYFRKELENGLPLLIDYTCFPWSYGMPAEDKLFAGAIPPEAVNTFRKSGMNHWVPYNIFHPEGKKLYLDYWRMGVDDSAAFPGKRLIFELFNEPGYDDPSAYNRALFAGYLKKRHHTVETMNRTWNSAYGSFEAAAAFRKQNENPGLFADWGKFMESGMTELAREGAAAIREKAPGGLVAYQILGRGCYRTLPSDNVNYYEISRYTDAISTPTTGGLMTRTSVAEPPQATVETPSNPAFAEGVLMRHFIRSLADGKPIHNPEAYARTDRQGNANVVWQDFLRGSDITYMFMWTKRAWDWNPAKTAEGGRRMAEKFNYQLANPYGFSVDSLAGFMDAKREIARFAEYFVPRGNRVPAEAAILLSFPTERRAVPTGYTDHHEVLNYAAGLEFSLYPADALVEEQLAGGRAAQKKYRALVAVGLRNTLPGTAAELRRFVEAGGILIAARDPLSEDEYGHPAEHSLFEGLRLEGNPGAPQKELVFEKLARTPLLPGRIIARNTRRAVSSPGWETLATVDSVPAVLHRTIGKGDVYFITPQLQDYGAAAVVKSILESHGIRPALELSRLPQGDLAVNIESHVVRHGGVQLAHLLNLDLYAKLVQVRLPKGMEAAADLLTGEFLPVAGDRATFLLGVNRYTILGFGTREELERRFGVSRSATPDELQRRYADMETARREELKKTNAVGFRFHTDSATTTPVNLRRFANTGFTDAIADDGQGGWTDQGAGNSLTGTPWEVTPLLGVPCDFIRYDENNDKTCIILRSESLRADMPEQVAGIPVDGKVRAIYFFHTAGWCRTGMKVMDYVIHYADGKSVTLPVVTGETIADWWLNSAGVMKSRIAWSNSQNRGFYISEWRNPEPERAVRSIDLVSACGRAIPIVIGITAERIPDSVREVNCASSQVRTWGNAVAEKKDQTITVKVSEKTTGWAGFSVSFPDFPKKTEKAVLHFEINGGEDPFGNLRGGQKLQLFLRDGNKTVGAKYRLPQPDGNSDTFETVSIPLDRLLTGQSADEKANGVGFQFLGGGSESGVVIKNLRITWPND